MKIFTNKLFLLKKDVDEEWSLPKRLIYYGYREIILFIVGFSMGMLLLILSLGPYITKDYIRYALPEYFSKLYLIWLNAMPVALIVLLLYGVIGRAWIAFLLSGSVFLSMGLGNYFKLWFRDDPLYFEDLTLLRETQNMVVDGKYRLFLDRFIIIVMLGLFLGTILLYFLVPGKNNGLKKQFTQIIIVVIIGSCIYPSYFDPVAYYRLGKSKYLDSSSYTQRFIAHGFVYPFIHSISDFKGDPPEGYSADKAKEILEDYKDSNIPEDRKISIIAIMREAYVDFSRLGVDGLDEESYMLYHQLEKESYRGDLLTNAAYGFTVYTERNFLTGNSKLKNYRGNTNAFPWYFKEQGYTVEGSHPYNQWFYNRRNVNGFLGFERYRFLENDFEKLTDLHYPDDELLFSEIYSDYKKNKENPYFSFSVTIEGHGPYDTESYNGSEPYFIGNYSNECKNAMNNYLDVNNKSDVALMKLVEKLRTDSEPVILVTFGDHLPWMGNGGEFYEEMGINIDTTSEEGFRTYYSTRYLIWANDAAEEIIGHKIEGEGPEISPCYLMNLIFQQLDWEGPAFVQAMNDMMEIFPVVTTNGRYVVDGVLTDSIPKEREVMFRDLTYLQQYWQSEFLFGK